MRVDEALIMPEGMEGILVLHSFQFSKGNASLGIAITVALVRPFSPWSSQNCKDFSQTVSFWICGKSLKGLLVRASMLQVPYELLYTRA
jgi:hypothetical protein